MLFAMLSISASAYESVEIDIIDVQTTNVNFVYNKRDFSNAELAEIDESYNVFEKDGKILVGFTANNANLQVITSNILPSFISVLEQYKPDDANRLKNLELNIESKFNGFPYGGRTTANISANNVEKPITIKSTGTFSIDNSSYVSEMELDGSNFPMHIEYGSNTIDELSISIKPQSNNKDVEVQYFIRSNKGVFLDMSTEALNNMGLDVIEQSPNNLVLVAMYDDLFAFNALFNKDLVDYFNIIGKINIDGDLSVTKSMKVDVDMRYSETLTNATIKIEMPNNAKDSESGQTGKIFTYDMTKPIQTSIEYKAANVGTIAIVIIVPICCAFVIGAFVMLNKRSRHMQIFR